MLIRNLRRPGDFARAVIANNDQLRIEIANDNRISKVRENVKRGIPEPQEDIRDLSERIGDINQRRQTTIDNLRQIFTAEQVDRFLSVLDDDTFQFLNLYWKDMKSDLIKKADVKLMDEFFFKNYLNKYIGTIMDQKGLSAPVGTQLSVNEIPELLSLFEWRDEAEKAFERMKKIDTDESKKLRELINLVPNKRRLQQIETLNDVDKQRVIEGISKSFSGINPKPEAWNNAINVPRDLEFYFAIKSLYNNMRNDEMETARTINDFLDDPSPPPPKLDLTESTLIEEDTSFIEDLKKPAPMRNIPLKVLKKAGKEAEAVKKQAEEDKKQEEARLKAESKKTKKGFTQAFAVEGEVKGETAEVRTMGQIDYMSPLDFNREEKGMVGKQVAYINLLKQTDILPDQLKLQLFYNKDTRGQHPMDYYKKPKQEGKVNREEFYENLKNKDREIKFAFEQRAQDEQSGKGMKRKPGRPKSGKGIASTCKESTPRWIELGRYRINGRLLDEKQLLSVRYQSGTATPQFPKMIPISDAFHELLTNLFETKKLDKRLMKELDPEEQRSAEVLLVKSGVGRSFGIKEITPTDEQAKKMKRFEVVKGSYLAGNNAPAVIHELRSLIIYFVETGHLSRKEGLRSLMELQ